MNRVAVTGWSINGLTDRTGADMVKRSPNLKPATKPAARYTGVTVGNSKTNRDGPRGWFDSTHRYKKPPQSGKDISRGQFKFKYKL